MSGPATRTSSRASSALESRLTTPSRGGSGEPREPLDWSILREYSAEESTRLGFDPRKSPESIARHLRVSPATVRRHLTEWRARGFLLGYDVLPHPGLLGGRLAARLIDFRDPIAQERAIESLRLIDGVVQIDTARTMLLAVYFVESPSQAERRFRQLEALEGVTRVGPEMVFDFPPCTRRMSARDWRLALALRRNPEASLSALAEELGQSARTTSRRYDTLLDAGALMFDPILDFARFVQTLAVLVASVDRPELVDPTDSAIRALHPQSIHAVGPTLPDAMGGPATVHRWVTAPTAAELDELSARVAHLPGVNRVDLWYGRSTLPVQAWMTERIEATLRVTRSGA